MKIQTQCKLKNLEMGYVFKKIDLTLTNGTFVLIFYYCYISFNFKSENCHNSIQIDLNSMFHPG